VITCDQCRDIVSIDHTAVDEAVFDHLAACPSCSAYLDAIIQIDIHGPSATRYVVSDSFSQRLLQSIDEYTFTSIPGAIDDYRSHWRVSLILGVTALICGIFTATLYNVTPLISFITPLYEILADIRINEYISQYYTQISDFIPIMELVHTQTVLMVILIIFWLIIVNSSRHAYSSKANHHISSHMTY
jgi:hypothetical protein